MSRTPLLGCLIVTCLLAAPLGAQTVAYTATVTQAAEVRCKPGSGQLTYVTNRLKAGDRVSVVQEREDGWVAIVPPIDSFSYVKLEEMKQVGTTYPCNWVFEPKDPKGQVPVYVGSTVIEGRPTVIGTYLTRGAQVRSRWKTLEDRDGQWLPIEPPAGEVRYLRIEALGKYPPPQQPVVAAPVVQPQPIQRAPLQATLVSTQPSRFEDAPRPPAPVPAPPPTTVQVSNPPPATTTPTPPASLWSQAAAAERAGRIPEAIDLYNRLYLANKDANPADADWAIKRAAFLRNGQAVATQPAAPAVNVSTSAQTKFVPLQTAQDPPAVTASGRGGFANPPAAAPAPAPQANRVDKVPEGPSARLKPPTIEAGSAATTQPVAATTTSNQKMYRSEPGTLVRAAIHIDNQPTYRLVTAAPNPVLYVTPGPGLDLEPFLDRTIELTGAAEYRGELRANHMQVYQVQPLATNP